VEDRWVADADVLPAPGSDWEVRGVEEPCAVDADDLRATGGHGESRGVEDRWVVDADVLPAPGHDWKARGVEEARVVGGHVLRAPGRDGDAAHAVEKPWLVLVDDGVTCAPERDRHGDALAVVEQWTMNRLPEPLVVDVGWDAALPRRLQGAVAWEGGGLRHGPSMDIRTSTRGRVSDGGAPVSIEQGRRAAREQRRRRTALLLLRPEVRR